MTGRILRRFAIWGLPPLVLSLVMVLGLAWWSFASNAGTRWLLQTVVKQLDGQVHGINGNLYRGLSIQDLELEVAGLELRLLGFKLQLQWSELFKHNLHVSNLSATYLDLRLHQLAADDAPPDEGEFTLPALPVTVRVDRFALGGLGLNIEGKGLPVEVLNLESSLALAEDGARLVIDDVQLGWHSTMVQVDGALDLHALASPWPFDLRLRAQAHDPNQDADLCLHQYLPVQESKPGPQHCALASDLHLFGSLDYVTAELSASGQGLDLQAQAQLKPEQSFPLESADVNMLLDQGPGLSLQLVPQKPRADGGRELNAHWRARELPLNMFLPPEIGASELNLQGQLDLSIGANYQLDGLGLQMQIEPGTRWNAQDLSGHIKLARLARLSGPLFDAQQEQLPAIMDLAVSGLDLDLTLGNNTIKAAGDITAADFGLELHAKAPLLAGFWPDLPGGAGLDFNLGGSLSHHNIKLQADYLPAQADSSGLGVASVRLALDTQGSWSESAGWAGQLNLLDLQHAGIRLANANAIELALTPALAWRVGAASLNLALQDEQLLQVQNLDSGGQGSSWHSKGQIPSIVITPKRIERILAWAKQADQEIDLGEVRTLLSQQAQDSQLGLALDWGLEFDQALDGSLALVRSSGDISIPADVPISLDLTTASLRLIAHKQAPGLSQLQMSLALAAQDKGSMSIDAQMPLHATAGGAMFVRAEDEKRLRVQAQSEDLSWLNLLIDGQVEVGGIIHADVQGRSLPDQSWVFNGPVEGENLRVLVPDEGVRLLDGTLAATFAGTRLELASLRFPANLRVLPKEARTAQWVEHDPAAKDGYLNLHGQWDISKEAGQVEIDFRRYPILQRSDRFAMISGSLNIQSDLPNVIVGGGITADAGWFDIDMLNTIPSLDSDVVVLQPGQSAPEPSAPVADVAANLSLDLGQRFYLTGFGVDTRLLGKIDIQLLDGNLRALGVVRTRGGRIDAYGQQLSLRRGIITFQGDITNPTLNIEALRTNEMVQAGVAVVGTARKPRIDLVSYPEVSETEKLSWLLLGRGPDEAGGADASLLLAVGSSFLAEGEPFYKRFGLDELGLRRGQIGSTGSVLPAQTVVSGLDKQSSPIEQQFLLAGKQLGKDVQLSLEQALDGTGTVGRIGYRLMRRLQAELTIGTVNGLALVYRWFSMK